MPTHLPIMNKIWIIVGLPSFSFLSLPQEEIHWHGWQEHRKNSKRTKFESLIVQHGDVTVPKI